MSRQPSNPDHKKTPLPYDLTLPAISAKVTFQGEQITYLVENQGDLYKAVVELHKAVVQGSASVEKAIEAQNKFIEAQFAKQNSITKLWSVVGGGAAAVLFRTLWEKLLSYLSHLLTCVCMLDVVHASVAP